MHQIVKRKESGMLVIDTLPGGRPISASALQDGAAVSSFREFQNQGAAVYKPPKS